MKNLKFISPFKVLRNQKGVAIFLAITSVALIAFIAVELSYDTASEYLIASQEVQRLKSRYAAKAGVEISLLRLHIYQKVQKQFGDQLGNNKGMLDMIWSTPFMWPPMLPGEANKVDQEALKDIVGDSLMEAKYLSTIESESAKIDLADLVSPSKGLAKYTKETILRILQNKLDEPDGAWAKQNEGLRAEELVNNIIDWMDTDTVSLNSGDESALYSKIDGAQLPPNQLFKTLDELHMVAGMTDSVYDYLTPFLTTYGVKGLQVNHASESVLRSLSSQITEEIAKEIIARRTSDDGPFKEEKEFYGFLEGRGVDTKAIMDQQIPLVFDSEYNFRITSTGNFGRTSSEIVAIVYDFDKVKERLTTILTQETQNANTGNNTAGGTGNTAATTGGATATGTTGNTAGGTGGSTAGSSNNNNDNSTSKKGRPSIVYWMER